VRPGASLSDTMGTYLQQAREDHDDTLWTPSSSDEGIFSGSLTF
jgi:hypothetical protein